MNFDFFQPFSLLTHFPSPKYSLEQYSTPIQVLKNYKSFFPIIDDNSFILDFGCGTGSLSFLSSLMGTNHVVGIDIDQDALKIASSNAKIINLNNITWINSAIEFFPLEKFKNNIDGVIMNPPFGTKRKFIDFTFLKKAFSTNSWVLSIHKMSNSLNSKLKELTDLYNYKITKNNPIIYPLKPTYNIHKLNNVNVKVEMFLFEPR